MCDIAVPKIREGGGVVVRGKEERLTDEEREIFSIFQKVHNPYEMYEVLREVQDLRIDAEAEPEDVQRHDWDTPLGIVLNPENT